jgi:hypothetical protein
MLIKKLLWDFYSFDSSMSRYKRWQKNKNKMIKCDIHNISITNLKIECRTHISYCPLSPALSWSLARIFFYWSALLSNVRFGWWFLDGSNYS